MKKIWSVILIIVVIAVAFGAVSAGVGVLTGADFDRIGEALQARIAEQYNVDAEAFVHEWVPQTAQNIQSALR